MPDAPAIARLPALTDAPPAPHDDDLAAGRGLLAAAAISLPLWALVVLAAAI